MQDISAAGAFWPRRRATASATSAAMDSAHRRLQAAAALAVALNSCEDRTDSVQARLNQHVRGLRSAAL